MGKDIKTFLFLIIISFLSIVGISTFNDGKNKVLGEVGAVSVDPASYDLGNVPINGGLVKKEYKVINKSGKSIKLKKIATSCMCTNASISINGKESKLFGMEHATDKNPPINIDIPADEVATVKVEFDPAAHGSEGMGYFERIVWLFFSDPEGIKELKFEGTVVN